jgi:hypothetical protein
MPIERERNRESARSAGKFKNRAAHPTREIAVEPLARTGLDYEIVERGASYSTTCFIRSPRTPSVDASNPELTQ